MTIRLTYTELWRRPGSSLSCKVTRTQAETKAESRPPPAALMIPRCGRKNKRSRAKLAGRRMESDNQETLLLGLAIAAIRARRATAVLRDGDGLLAEKAATAEPHGAGATARDLAIVATSGHQVPVNDGATTPAEFSLLRLPALCDVSESALARCTECVHAESDWPVLVAKHIESAVREVLRKRVMHSVELSSIALAAIHMLVDGCVAQAYCESSTCITSPHGYATRMACQAIIEACGLHVQTAIVVLDACVDAAAGIIEALAHDLSAGRALVLDDSRARAMLASAHLFEALESVTVLLRAHCSLAGLQSTQKLLTLEQTLRDSDLNFQAHFPLIASSIKQCAWVALNNCDDAPRAHSMSLHHHQNYDGGISVYQQ